jgi:hypothetical protein
MSVSVIKKTHPEEFFITSSAQMYEMHNVLPLFEHHFCTVQYDVMLARTGLNATGQGFCVKLDNDVVDFILVCGLETVFLRVSNNAVSRRAKMSATIY